MNGNLELDYCLILKTINSNIINTSKNFLIDKGCKIKPRNSGYILKNSEFEYFNFKKPNQLNDYEYSDFEELCLNLEYNNKIVSLVFNNSCNSVSILFDESIIFNRTVNISLLNYSISEFERFAMDLEPDYWLVHQVGFEHDNLKLFYDYNGIYPSEGVEKLIKWYE